jgi:nitrogen fixation NifU-like protein
VIDDLYSENIIDHYQHPRNFGELKCPTHQSRGANASCGDALELQIRIDRGLIAEVAFKGVGCALSTAAASMLTEKIKGKTIDEVKKIGDEQMIAMMGIEISATRIRCVTLPLTVLQKMIADKND